MEFAIERVSCKQGDIKPIREEIKRIKEELEFIYKKIVYKDIDIIPIVGGNYWEFQIYIVKILYEVE